MNAQRIYLDHAATTPLRPEARAAMEEGFRIWANPSSPHAEGRRARAALEDARERIKAALGWEGECIFTSGASEAAALALETSWAERRIVSAVEHDAVLRAAPDAEVVDVAATGLPDLDQLIDKLRNSGPAVCAFQTINSETGHVVLSLPDPDNEVSEAIRENGGALLADCSQSAGKRPLPWADMAIVSAHKLGGPIGVGALLVRDFDLLKPSGGQERGYRAGTENLPGVLGFAAALECGGSETWATSESERFDFKTLHAENGDVCTEGPSIEYIVPLTHPSLAAQAALIRLDAAGFSVSAGSACSSGSLKPSRVLKAFGMPEDVAARTLRISMGWNTTKEELERFNEVWLTMAREAV